MKPISIVGGGLAGLSLGLKLRQYDVPATVYEAGHYPRHRVCGEFISGNGQRMLEQLNLPTTTARTAAFFAGADRCSCFNLPQAAVCVSRYDLDKALADAFCAAGGNLICGTRVNLRGASVVHASGRRLHAVENGWRWFGLKAHAIGVDLHADLEMHLVPNGYIGMCRLPGGRVNVCGLFRKRKGDTRTVTLASHLEQRLKGAQWIDGSAVAVSGLCFCAPPADAECHIGDAHGMIAPLTGNGMSLAFESAAAAVDPLVSYARGCASWPEAVRQINTALAGFHRRLVLGKWLQRAAFHSWLLSLIALPSLRKMLFAATR